MKRARPTRATLTALVLLGLFVLALVLATAALIEHDRRGALAEAEAEVQIYVDGAAASLNRNFLGIDILLATIEGQLGLANLVERDLDPVEASRRMQSVVQPNLVVNYVALINDRGEVVASSASNGADLSVKLPPGFAQEVLGQMVAAQVVSAPQVSFTSSEPVLYFGRRFNLAGGGKLVGVAEVKVIKVTSILTQGVDIPGLEVTLERRNGQLLASVPAIERMSGKYLAPVLGDYVNHGPNLRLPARLGRTPSIMVVRPVLFPGGLIAASVPEEVALQKWRSQSLLLGGGALLFAAMILAAGGFGIWYFRRLAAAQAGVKQAKDTLDQALGAMVNGFLLLNAELKVVTWNRRYEEIFPWQVGTIAHMLPYRHMMELAARKRLAGEKPEVIETWVERRMDKLKVPQGKHDVVQPSGGILEVTEQSTPDGGVVMIFQDVTELRNAVGEIEQLAFYDTLTSLPNRRLLTDRMQQAIAAGARSGRCGALMFLDLDHFKTLNDTLGHDMGDLLLLQVAQRLKACVRAEDTVARLGGDEFVVMLQGLSSQVIEAAAQTKQLGEKILASLKQPFNLDNQTYQCGCSIGATFFSDGQQTPADLLRQADIAMYQAKHSGRNTLCFFDPEMLATITARSDLEKDLHRALAEGEFSLHYQVQMTGAGHAVGAEALIRWEHPRLGLIGPGEFIGLAEETGLIVPIGQWVVETACRQIKSWEGQPGLQDLQLAVNVSARQLRQADFVTQVSNALQQSGAKPGRLELELTESMVLDNVKDTILKMKTLKALGVRLSMDDFGTGYSSLAYLTQLPLDQLKIDRSFVRNIGLQSTDAVIIQTIIGMAHNLGLEVIAEGVETKLQQDFLEAQGCPLWQGYLYSKPLPLADFEKFLQPAGHQ